LTPKILKNSQDFVQNKFNTGHNPVDFLFSMVDLVQHLKKLEALATSYKMNIDTDLQFAFTEGIRDYIEKY
jgi:fructose-bisphosphate aldolase class II